MGMLDPLACPMRARTTADTNSAFFLDGAWSDVTLNSLPTVSRRSPERSGPLLLSVVNTGLFQTTLSASVKLADGLPAWETPAAPSSAPTAAVPMTSSVSSLSDPELAPANPASSPRSLSTETGSKPNLVAPSSKFFPLPFLENVILFSVVCFFYSLNQ